jgi:hypothetical protein
MDRHRASRTNNFGLASKSRRRWVGQPNAQAERIKPIAATESPRALHRCVHFKEHALHGGGHHIAANAVAESGLMIDLPGMRTVSIDGRMRTAGTTCSAMNPNIAPVDA